MSVATFYKNIFCGLYEHFLRFENGGRFDDSSYYAYSAILGVCLFECLFLLALGMLIGGKIFSIYGNAWSGSLVVACVFLLNWVYFFKVINYKELIKAHVKNEKNIHAGRHASYIFLGITGFVFAAAVITKIIEFS